MWNPKLIMSGTDLTVSRTKWIICEATLTVSKPKPVIAEPQLIICLTKNSTDYISQCSVPRVSLYK